jgi:hypothetical protein
VFGRCIAGPGFAGNYGYFKAIIALGSTGVLSAAVAGAAGMANEFGWAGIGFSALVMLILYVCGAGRIMFNMGGCGCVVTKVLVSCGCKKSRRQRLQEAQSARQPPSGPCDATRHTLEGLTPATAPARIAAADLVVTVPREPVVGV